MSHSQASEQSPLLGEENPESPGNTPDNGDPTKKASDSRLALIMGSIWIGVVLTSIDSTIVATLLVPISSSFSSLKNLSWIGSAYLIGQSITQPLSGRLTEIFGRREGLLVCNVTFTVGTLLCGIATKEWILIFGRAVAGLGGGAMMTICMFVTGDLVPLRKRGTIQGTANIAIGAGSGLGGVLGGWMDSIWGWRTAFLVQIPFLVASATLVHFTVKVPKQKSETSALKRVDYLGSFTLTCALVLFLLGVNTGGNILPWTHPLVLVSLPLSALFLLLFIFTEERLTFEPIIPMQLLLDRTVAAVCLSYWFTFMAFYGVYFFMPVYLQLVGNSPTEAGVRFIASSAATAVGAFGAGVIMQATGNYSHISQASHVLIILGSALMVSLDYQSPAWCPFLYLTISGLGFGGMLVTTMISLVSAVGQESQALVTSAAFAFRSTGSAIGLTVASAAFQNLLRLKLQMRIGDLDDANNIIDKIRDNFDQVNQLPDAILGSVRESYMDALKGVFLITLGFRVIAGLSSLFIRQHKLHGNLARQ